MLKIFSKNNDIYCYAIKWYLNLHKVINSKFYQPERMNDIHFIESIIKSTLMISKRLTKTITVCQMKGKNVNLINELLRKNRVITFN